MHVVDKWLCKWRLDPNVSKSKHMVINPGARELAPDTPGIELCGQRVERVVEYKYLGVFPARRQLDPTCKVCTV